MSPPTRAAHPPSVTPDVARRRLRIAAELLEGRREEARAAGLTDDEIAKADGTYMPPELRDWLMPVWRELPR